MNFQYITPIPSAQSLLDHAFKKAREKGASKKLHGEWFEKIQKKETLKIDIIKDQLEIKIAKIMDLFPSTLSLPPFYVKLMKFTIDIGEYKKSLSILKWGIKQLRSLQRTYSRAISKAENRDAIKRYSKEFYGRVSSIMKQLEKPMKFLSHCRQVFRTYPDIKDEFTIVIYGFPNVGKTTLLNKISGTKAEVDSYAFTTKSINAGYTKTKGHTIQVLDVPGTLARDKVNDIERQAQLVLDMVADVVVYVYDLTEFCGYSLQDQQRLHQEVTKSGKPVFVFLSKQDLFKKEGITTKGVEHSSLTAIKSEIFTMIQEEMKKEMKNKE